MPARIFHPQTNRDESATTRPEKPLTIVNKPALQFDVSGSVPDSAISALARMLLDVADKELSGNRSTLETAQRPPDNERTAEVLHHLDGSDQSRTCIGGP